jgi:hypothetical protein
MPLFWVEQKFVMDADKSSQIKIVLEIPEIGRILGVVLLFLGCILMLFRHMSKVFQRTVTVPEKLNFRAKIDDGNIVITDIESNPLMSRHMMNCK